MSYSCRLILHQRAVNRPFLIGGLFLQRSSTPATAPRRSTRWSLAGLSSSSGWRSTLTSLGDYASIHLVYPRNLSKVPAFVTSNDIYSWCDPPFRVSQIFHLFSLHFITKNHFHCFVLAPFQDIFQCIDIVAKRYFFTLVIRVLLLDMIWAAITKFPFSVKL